MTTLREQFKPAVLIAPICIIILFVATLAPYYFGYIGYTPIVSGTALCAFFLGIDDYRSHSKRKIAVRVLISISVAAVGSVVYLWAAMFVLLNTLGA